MNRVDQLTKKSITQCIAFLITSVCNFSTETSNLSKLERQLQWSSTGFLNLVRINKFRGFSNKKHWHWPIHLYISSLYLRKGTCFNDILAKTPQQLSIIAHKTEGTLHKIKLYRNAKNRNKFLTFNFNIFWLDSR